MSEGTWKMLGIGAALAAVIVTFVAIDQRSKLKALEKEKREREEIAGAVDALREWKGRLGRVTRNLSSFDPELEEPLKKLAASEAPDARWWEAQGRLWMMDYDGALKAIARGGDDPRLSTLKALTLYERQRLTQFLRLYHAGVGTPQFVRDEPINKQQMEALEALKAAAKRAKGDDGAVIALALLAHKGPEPQAAEAFSKEIAQAIEAASKIPTATAQKICADAACYFNTGDADALYTRSREIMPGHYETVVAHAWRLFASLSAAPDSREAFEKALRTAETARELRPDRSEAYMILGGIAMLYGREAKEIKVRISNLDEAVKHFESAMRFAGGDDVAALTNRAGAHLARAKVHAEAKDAESAAKDLSDALRYAKEANGRSEAAVYVRAQVRLAADVEHDGAIEDFTRIYVGGNRTNAEAARSLSEVLMRRGAIRASQQGKESEAEADFKTAIDLLSDRIKALKEEETPRFYALRGRTYVTRASWYAARQKEARPEFDLGIADLKRAAEKLDKDKDAAVEYGRALQARGAFDVGVGGVDAPTAMGSAIEQFGAVIKAYPEAVDGHLLRALCHLQVAGALTKAKLDASKSFDAFDADVAGALKADETSADAYQLYGEGAEVREKWADAERGYLQAIQLDGRRMQTLGPRVKAIREKAPKPPTPPPPEKAPEKQP